MAGGYDKAGRDVHDMVDEIIQHFHPDFVECQLTVGVQMAHPTDVDKPAIVVKGVPRAYKVSKTSVPHRVQDMPDVMIYLDSQSWANYSETEKKNTLDEALYHFELVREKNGAFKLDKALRPLLKSRPYDYSVEGYNIHIRRYGEGGTNAKAIQELSLHRHTLLPPIGPGPATDQIQAAVTSPWSAHVFMPTSTA